MGPRGIPDWTHNSKNLVLGQLWNGGRPGTWTMEGTSEKMKWAEGETEQRRVGYRHSALGQVREGFGGTAR